MSTTSPGCAASSAGGRRSLRGAVVARDLAGDDDATATSSSGQEAVAGDLADRGRAPSRCGSSRLRRRSRRA